MSTSKPGLFRLASYLIGANDRKLPKRRVVNIKTYVLTGNIPPRFALILSQTTTITREQHR